MRTLRALLVAAVATLLALPVTAVTTDDIVRPKNAGKTHNFTSADAVGIYALGQAPPGFRWGMTGATSLVGVLYACDIDDADTDSDGTLSDESNCELVGSLPVANGTHFTTRRFLFAEIDTAETAGTARLTIKASYDQLTNSRDILQDIAKCSRNYTKPNDCPGVEVVSSQAALETCGGQAGESICLLTESLNVQAADRGSAFYEGVKITVAEGASPKIICAPGTEIRVTGVSGQDLSMFVFNDATSTSGDAGSHPAIYGCSIEEYTSAGVPGESTTGHVEGIVNKRVGTGNSYTYATYFTAVRNKVYQYSDGTAGFVIGNNPSTRVYQNYVENEVHGILGFDAKIYCSGCDDMGILMENNRVYCDFDGAAATPAAYKFDDDANMTVIGGEHWGCAILFDQSAGGSDTGNAVYINTTWHDFGGTGNNDFIVVSNTLGTAGLYGYGNKLQNINPVLQFMIATGGITADIEFEYLDCPTTFTEWVDLTGIDGVSGGSTEILGPIRLVVDLPPGCTPPTTAQILSSTTPTEVQEASTRLFAKVGATTANIYMNGGTAVETGQTVSGTLFQDAYGIPIFVAASPGTSYDTGFEVGGHAGRQCLGVYVASTGALLTDGDADGTTCDETISAASIVMTAVH